MSVAIPRDSGFGQKEFQAIEEIGTKHFCQLLKMQPKPLSMSDTYTVELIFIKGSDKCSKGGGGRHRGKRGP